MLSGLSGSTMGRLAFRYLVTDTNVNGDYVGLDTLELASQVSQTPLPAAVSRTACGESAAIRRARSWAKLSKINGTI